MIGNGFDLAHGLKTSYGDFIDWFWKKEFNELRDPKQVDADKFSCENTFFGVSLKYSTLNITRYRNFSFEEFKKEINGFDRKYNCRIFFKNRFLEIILNSLHLQNWVDIEEEYFTQLKNVIDNQIVFLPDEKYTIEKLNKDFDEIKTELAKYLTKELKKVEERNLGVASIGQTFNIADFTSHGTSVFREEYLPKAESEIAQYNRMFDFYLPQIETGEGNYIYCDTQIHPSRTLFFNFNYTDLPERMKRNIDINGWQFGDWAKGFDHIPIHGQLNDSKSPIIFGYGDEQDEVHRKIEKLGGAYLDNIKTINYLKTRSYKNLLGFVESDIYQVFIWGHSCGLSDKTLLSTVFEHKNCVSIKPFYYIDKNKHNNYDDIVKNIYRCFADKKLMREKVVNKRFCEELIQ